MPLRLRPLLFVLASCLGLALPAISDGFTARTAAPRPASLPTATRPVPASLQMSSTATDRAVAERSAAAAAVEARVVRAAAVAAAKKAKSANAARSKKAKATTARAAKVRRTKAAKARAAKARAAAARRAKAAQRAKPRTHAQQLRDFARKKALQRRQLQRVARIRARQAQIRAEIRAAQVAATRLARIRTAGANPAPAPASRPDPFTTSTALWRRPSVVRALIGGARLPALVGPDSRRAPAPVKKPAQSARKSSTKPSARSKVRTPFAHPKPKRAPKKAAKKNAPKRTATTTVPRGRPGHVGIGHYIRSLNGHAQHDRRIMYAVGARDAARNPGGQQHLVLLDIGGQTRGGVLLSTTRRHIGYAALRRAMIAYVDGYHSRQRGDAPVMIAIGTNNDLAVSVGTGREWALRVVNPVRQHAARYADMTIAGANDIEPGFRAGVRATQAWLLGYLAHTSAPFVFNGSADACSWTAPRSRCGFGWTAHQLAWFAGVARPDRIIALPQVYNRAMAGQWAFISRTAMLEGHAPLRIVGPLTENVACGRDPDCPTMPSSHAWAALWSRFKVAHVPAPSMPIQVDLDVH